MIFSSVDFEFGSRQAAYHLILELYAQMRVCMTLDSGQELFGKAAALPCPLPGLWRGSGLTVSFTSSRCETLQC